MCGEGADRKEHHIEQLAGRLRKVISDNVPGGGAIASDGPPARAATEPGPELAGEVARQGLILRGNPHPGSGLVPQHQQAQWLGTVELSDARECGIRQSWNCPTQPAALSEQDRCQRDGKESAEPLHQPLILGRDGTMVSAMMMARITNPQGYPVVIAK